jgi:hypothetical protein
MTNLEQLAADLIREFDHATRSEVIELQQVARERADDLSIHACERALWRALLPTINRVEEMY